MDSGWEGTDKTEVTRIITVKRYMERATDKYMFYRNEKVLNRAKSIN